jgi:carboxyl-terminal processing protease
MGGTAGSITGVGLEVGFEDKGKGASQMTVVSPNQGSPAQKAGILPGDALLSVNGKSTATMGLYDAAGELQGPEGR